MYFVVVSKNTFARSALVHINRVLCSWSISQMYVSFVVNALKSFRTIDCNNYNWNLLSAVYTLFIWVNCATIIMT